MSVVIRVPTTEVWLSELLASLDAQSLPVDQFEVVLEPVGDDQDLVSHLARLSDRRPNVTVAAPGQGLDHATGSHVVDLGTSLETRRPTLPPDSLHRLIHCSAASGGASVFGRTAARQGGPVHAAFRGDSSGASAPSTFDPVAAHAMVARAVGNDTPAVILAGPPVLLVEELPVPSHAPEFSVTSSEAQWVDGRLQVAVTVRSDTASPQLFLSVLERRTGIEHWIPCRTTPEEGACTAVGDIDVRNAAGGDPLAPGLWQVRVGVANPGWADTTFARPADAPVALVEGIPVVPRKTDGALTLDVDARRTTPVGRIGRDDVDIVESARGTLLTARLPRLAVFGPARLRGEVFIGSFSLPADLVADGDGARIEVWVSSLAVTAPLSTRFGRGPAALTGLDLNVSPVGEVTVRPATKPTKRAAPAKAAAGATAKKSAAGGTAKKSAAARAPGSAKAQATKRKAPTSTVGRLRRKVPAALEPAVTALSRNEAARRMYRRLNRR